MSSLDSALLKQAMKRGKIRVSGQDAAVGLRLRYIGSGTVTTVATTQATSVVLTTSDGGVDTYLFSGYSTMGALSDAINADGIFECKVMDALRSENPDDWFATSAGWSATTDLNGNVVYDLLSDNSAALTHACVFSPQESFDDPTGHRVHLQQVDYLVNNTAAYNTLKIYERNIKTGAETLIYYATNTDNSATSLTFASGNAQITSKWDHELVVIFDGTVVDSSTGYIICMGEYE